MGDKYTYLGKGKVYLGPYKGAGPMRFVGNVSELTLQPQEQEISVPDMTQPGGGKYDSVRRIEAVNMTMTEWDLSPQNLADALDGTTASVVAGAVVDEPHTAYVGGLVSFEKIPDPAVAVVVEAAVGMITYDEGDDYIRTSSGIEITTGSSIVDGTEIQVSYTALASDLVQALSSSNREFKLTFEGLNEAESGNPVIVKLHRVKFGPAQNLPLIGSEFATIQMNGDVLADAKIITPGLSRYFTINRAKAV